MSTQESSQKGLIMQINIENSEMIMDAYKPLILAVTNKFQKYEKDESIDEARMILMEAILTYDAEKATFGYYLKQRLYYHFLDKGKKREVLSLNEKNQEGDELIDSLIDTTDFEEDLLRKDRIRQILTYLEILSPKDRKIVEMRYLKEMTNQEIGERLKISTKTVANRLSLSLKKLREEFS